MHVLRVVRVLLPVLIVAAVVAAGSSVLSARPDLQKAKRNVDTSWSSLSGQLDHRYVLLAAVDDKLAADSRTDPHARQRRRRRARALARRVHALRASPPRSTPRTTSRRSPAGWSPPRRRRRACKATPRCCRRSATFLADCRRAAAARASTSDVVSYEHERRGPVRTVVASVLGDGAIPVLDTTATPRIRRPS